MTMHASRYHQLCIIAACYTASCLTVPLPPYGNSSTSCRYLPGDIGWPTDEHWDRLNSTTGGRLVRGTPLAEPCYSPVIDLSSDACTSIQHGWVSSQS
ncbi:hypothetical protein F5X99DRAFT_370954 [Biscogniauxia marginata]|nr:hypothetical protein F5X99DRAFT_370954 [Biscogniauxia marginata]